MEDEIFDSNSQTVIDPPFIEIENENNLNTDTIEYVELTEETHPETNMTLPTVPLDPKDVPTQIDPLTHSLNYKKQLNAIFELSEDELNKIDEYVRNKIIKNGENFLQQHDSLRSSYEKFNIEYEQRFMELEAEYTECQTKLSFESKNAHLFRLKANENDEKLGTLTKQNRILENEKETLLSDQHRLNSINQNLEAEKRDLHVLLDKKIKDNDRLNAEWKDLNTKLGESESKICEMTAKMEELESKSSTIQFKEKQFQSEKERLLNEIEWLNQQLKEKSNQILDTKTASNKKIYELETRIDDLSADNKKYLSQIETLREANDTMEKQIEDLTKKLQEVREREVQCRIDFSEESQAREKLIELYKEESESCQEKLVEAGNCIIDLKSRIDEIRNEYSKVLDEKLMMETEYDARRKEYEENISKLDQELKNANELLSIAKRKGATVLSESDIEQLSPAAAVASRLLKSGMTLTQIYSEYVNLTETLQQERAENERNKSYIKEIIKDLEESAPIMKRKNQEYEESQKAITNLTTQLENAMMDYEVLKSKSEDSIKKYNLIASENYRLKQDCSDFSRQITVLLHEVELLRGKLVSNPNKSVRDNDATMVDTTTSIGNLFDSHYENPNESIAEVSSSSEINNRNVFLFRNIEELQKQNQKLVRLMHELTDKKQSEEKHELELRTKEFNEKISLCMRELDEFRAQREKHEHVVEEIRKQRDTYKQLVDEYQIQKNQQIPKTPRQFYTSTPGDIYRVKASGAGSEFSDNLIMIDQDKQQDQELQQKLAETNAVYDKLKAKFEKYQTEMMRTNKELNEQIDEFRTLNTDLKMKVTLSESKLESALEKCKTLITSNEKFKKELEIAKERSSKFNELIIKHEQSINNTSFELNKARERICELETRLHSITIERDLNRANLERLTRDHETLIRENASRALIFSNLESIKNTCERNERETRLILTQKIELLEKENLIQSKQIEQDKQQNEIIIKSWKNQYEQLSEQNKKENAEHEKVRQLLNETQSQLEELKQKYNEVEAKLHSNEILVQMTRNSKSSSAISRLTHLEEENKEMQKKLSEADKDIVSLKIQLEESRGHAKQFKIIANTMEKNVKDASEANERIKQVLEGKITELNDMLSQLQIQHEQVLSNRNDLENRIRDEAQRYDEKINELESDKSRLTYDLDELTKKYENNEKILEERTRFRDEHVAKIAVLEEQLKQNEEKIYLLENELNEKNSKLNELTQELQTSNELLEQEKKLRQEQKESFDSNEQLLNQNINNLKTENENLLNQINLLQEELSKVGQDLIVLQKQDKFAKLDITSESSSHSSSNLLEINRYLRTEKDQLNEKYESLKLDYELIQQKYKTAEQDLDFQRKQSQIYESEINVLKQNPMGSRSNESALNSDNLNLMLDTNKRLKEECDSLNNEINKLNVDIREKEDEISNLKTNLNASELRYESILGENTSMKSEVKRWKDRFESIMNSSDMKEEWDKVQTELQNKSREKDELEEKNQVLTDMINELRANLADLNAKCDQSEVAKQQAINEKLKVKQELENVKSDKNKREELFRTLASEYREMVTLLQRELEIKDDTLTKAKDVKAIKDELSSMKRKIIEKVKEINEELKNKNKQIDESSSDIKKKLEEYDSKLKEKEIRVGQLSNVIGNLKTKLNNQKKTIDDQTKELSDLKTGQADTSLQEHQKTELDEFKSKFLQTKIEMEKLKKELATKISALNEANNRILNSTNQTGSVSVASTPAITSPKQQTPASAVISSLTTSVTPSAATPTSTETNQQTQPPPTAYITPSRITKVQPASQAQTLPLRRTAAVQPTPHDSGTSSAAPTQSRQQLVTPLNMSNDASQWTQVSTQSIQSENIVEQHPTESAIEQVQAVSSMSTNVNPSTSSGTIAKRTREDDHTDETMGTSNSLNINKKQRSSVEHATTSAESDNFIQLTETHQNINLQVVEPFSMNTNTGTDQDNNDYIVITDELQSNEVQEIQDNQEEIVLDDDTNGESQSSEYEEVILPGNRGTLTSDNQNNEEDGNDDGIGPAGVDDDGNEIQQEHEEHQHEELQDDNDQDNNNNNNGEDDQVDQGGNEENAEDDDNNGSGDIHLEIQADDDNENEQEQQQIEQNQDSEGNNQQQTGDDQNLDSQTGDGNQEQQNQNLPSPDSSAANNAQQSQPQSQSNNQFTADSSQGSTSSSQTRISTNLASQVPHTNIRPTFGSNTQPNNDKKPKPIVWDGQTTSVPQLFQSQANPTTSGGSFKIRRTPVSQSLNAQATTSPNQNQSLFTQMNTPANQQTQANYFQQELQMQTQQQTFQGNQYRLQNNRFQLTNTNINPANVSNTSEILFAQQQQQQQQNQLIQQPRLGEQRVNMRGPRAQLAQPQQQQPGGRIIATMNPRLSSGNNLPGRGGLSRGGGNAGQSNRGGRASFQ